RRHLYSSPTRRSSDLALETMVMEAAQQVARESIGEGVEEAGDESSTAMPGQAPADNDQEESTGNPASVAASKARAVSNDLFWNGRELPTMPEPKIAPAIDDSDPDLLRK